MITSPELEKQPYRIACGTVWGGIKPVSLDVCTKGVTVSLHSTAAGAIAVGTILPCTVDLRTPMLIADVRGHGERVSEISSWIYECLQDKMNSVDCAQVLSDLNCGSLYAVSTDLEEAIIEAESLRSRLPRLNVLAAKHTVRIA